jgi:hemerythrin-like metal-binding protein
MNKFLYVDFISGHNSFDKDHSEFVELTSELYYTLESKTYDIKLKNIISYLNNHSVNHFKQEEEYMLDNKYPNIYFNKHIKHHNDFLMFLNKLVESRDKNNLLLTLELILYMRDWFSNHILNEDVNMVKYIKARG